MPTPVTLESLIEEVAHSAGFALLDVGLYLDGPGGTTRAILRGLARGLLAVGVIPADPLNLTDADVAGLGAAAILRVVAVAELNCLRAVLGRWHLQTQTQGLAAFAKADDVRGGWVPEEKAAILRRVADLEAEVATSFADPLNGSLASINQPPAWPCCGPYGAFPCD